jgi:hypothetical protein
MESVTDGRQCRLATTNDYLGIAEQVSGKKLDWFFNLYLRQPTLPKLRYSKSGTVLSLQWVTPNYLPFTLPVDVRVGRDTVVVNMQNGTGTVSIPADTSYQIDPGGWILMDLPQPVNVTEQNIPTKFAMGVYPNPFNPTTTLWLEIPKRMHVSGELVSILGQRIKQIVDGWFEAGVHLIPVTFENQSSGVYFMVVRGDKRVLTKKVVLLR